MTESTQQLLARVSEILARAEKASTAPWKASTQDEIGDNWPIVMSMSLGNSGIDGNDYHVSTDDVHASEFSGDAKTDADFIAASRSDIPALCHAVQELANPWISVKERLPEKGLIVIVDGGIARYEGERGWITETSGAHGCRIEWNVTHWMPLPQPPDGETK